MSDFRDEFIELAVACEVLRFGEFTLKSGRVSPYFFNAGLFNTGARLANVGRFYANAIVASGIDYDMLFGPAYKGITLVAATAVALAEHHGLDVPWCFNRKEIKDHGEGGQLIGSPLAGRVLLVDDVITAGTAIGEAVEIIRAHGATPAGVIIAIDRQEKVESGQSAVQTVMQSLGVTVVSIATLDHILHYLEVRPELVEVRQRIDAYRARYGIAD